MTFRVLHLVDESHQNLKFWVKCRGDRCKGVKTNGPIVNYVPGDGGGFEGGGGGYNFKTSPFLGGKFFTGKKHEGGSNFMTQQQQCREFDVSDLSSIPWLGKRKELNI